MNKCLVFDVGGGGIGKNIVATSLIPIIKKIDEEADLIVIAHHHKVFKNNPLIKTIYRPQTPQLYTILNTYYDDITWFSGEPYKHYKYIKQQLHIIPAWLDKIGIKADKYPLPKLFLNDKEQYDIQKYIKSKKNKPIILIQSSGGAVDNKTKRPKRMFVRDADNVAIEQIIKKYKEEYYIVQVLRQGQYRLIGVDEYLQDIDIRQIFCFINEASIILCIDSFVQHAATALGKKAIVLWAATNPKILGYPTNINITSNKCKKMCGRPNSFLYDTEPDFSPFICKFSDICTIHDFEDIDSAIIQLKNEFKEDLEEVIEEPEEVVEEVKEDKIIKNKPIL